MTTYININGDVRDASSITVPTDRTFRGAWTFSGEAVEVDMAAARDIWRDKIRAAREPELAKLDTAYMKALETSADTTQIIADKQALRDAPAHSDIDAATTPDALKLVQPISGVTVE
jgi:hypothetical protein